jgi:hypothetical protein
MAFNKQIDADRVDNLGLFSSFLRAPILGPVVWAVGKFTKTQDENEPVIRNSAQISPPCIDEDFSSMSLTSSESTPHISPDRIGILFNDDIRRKNLPFECPPESDLPLAKKNRKTSWSDQSGQSLAQYYRDEVSITAWIRTGSGISPSGTVIYIRVTRCHGGFVYTCHACKTSFSLLTSVLQSHVHESDRSIILKYL